jgi:hypothetical protein
VAIGYVIPGNYWGVNEAGSNTWSGTKPRYMTVSYVTEGYVAIVNSWSNNSIGSNTWQRQG